MIPMIRALFEHMAWADSTLLEALREHAGAYEDEQLKKLLHHILVVQRFFLSLLQATPFDMEREGKIPASSDEMERRFHQSRQDATQFIAQLQESDLTRTFELPRMKEFQPTMRDLLIQVAMHSEHHRAQCATRLRELGGKPPVLDYILWVKTA